MFTIATLNKISSKGLACLTRDYLITEDAGKANGILVRSQDMKAMEFSTDLLAVARAGAGVNNIPLARCADQGIVVFNTPGANANAVKELVLAGLFMAARNIGPAVAWASTLTTDVAKAVEAGKSQFAGTELKDKTIGVVGLGAIGVLVANACVDLGMRVVGYDPFMSIRSAHALSPMAILSDHLDKVLPQCDYVTVHVPFMDETRGMFHTDAFAMMKTGACLLNFSRDALVNDRDVLAALESGHLRLYVTDFPNDHLIGQKGVLCIPHLGASTEEAEENCAVMAARQIMDYLENGNITNSVNFPPIQFGSLTDRARLVILHRSSEATLAVITGALATLGLRAVNLTHHHKDDYGVTMTDLDGQAEIEALRQALRHPDILLVRLLRNPPTPR